MMTSLKGPQNFSKLTLDIPSSSTGTQWPWKSFKWILHGSSCWSISLGDSRWKVPIKMTESANPESTSILHHIQLMCTITPIFSLMGILTLWTVVRPEHLITEWHSSGKKEPFHYCESLLKGLLEHEFVIGKQSTLQLLILQTTYHLISEHNL